MKTSRLIIFILIVITLLRCDNPESPAKSYFVKYFGDEGQHTGVDVEVNPDGTFILLGTLKLVTNQPADNSQFYVVKADEFGNVLWERTFGGPMDEEAKDVELLSDGTGDMVIVGNSFVTSTSRDILLMRLNSEGTLVDSVLVNFPSGVETDQDVTSVTETLDGFIVAGSTDDLHNGANIEREFLFARFKPDLTPYGASWPILPSYGQTTESVATKFITLSNGNFYGFGYAKFSVALGGIVQNDFDYQIFSLNQDGTSLTGVQSYGTSGVDDKLGSVAIVPPQLGSGYFLAGIVTDLSGNDDMYVVKLREEPIMDNSPEAGFPKFLGLSLLKPASEHVSATSSLSGGYLIMSNEAFAGNNTNLLLTKIALNGQTLWQVPIIYGGQGDDFVGSVRELPDGKIIIVGTMTIGQLGGETKMVLMKVNSEGRFAD